MAKFKFKGAEEYIGALKNLEQNTTPILKQAVYSGAGVAADAVRKSIEANIPVVQNYIRGGPEEPLRGITEEQKRGLLDGLGVSTMANDDGYINAAIGFAGYNATKTKSYPRGQPNALIARALESGTSFRIKIPFVRMAVSAAQREIQQAMAEKLDAAIAKTEQRGI